MQLICEGIFIMKKSFILALVLMCFTSVAQQYDSHPHGNNRPIPNESATIVINAAQGEQFMVYVDGNIVNRKPQQHVVVDHLDYSNHDIYVVLTSPQDKITMVTFRPTSRREECLVHFDPRRNQVELLLPEQVAQMKHLPNTMGRPVAHHPEAHVVVHCSDEEVTQMVEMLKSQSFDSTREKLALNYAENHRLLASQILRLAQEFTFDSSKKEFLKKAYAFCVDPENYAIVVNCLTFTTDKEEILDFINR